MKIITVVGARPNLMKMAPIMVELSRYPSEFEPILVHTGQHYDERMSRLFFEQLGLPDPDFNLKIGSGSRGQQIAQIMSAFEELCLRLKPDLVLVVGDVNSTLACALAAKKAGIQVAHVEAGLRSHDMSMPEEINRICTDAISDYLFTTDHTANENLHREGISNHRIHFVGNVMIDTLYKYLEAAQQLDLVQQMGLRRGEFATLTLHRPSNVDEPHALCEILEAISEIAKEFPVVFPIHPRTHKIIKKLGLSDYLNPEGKGQGLRVTEPLGYLEFLHLNINARIVFTDSGGLQEETTALGIPCITIRNNTERPITCTSGTNELVGNKKDRIIEAFRRVMQTSSTKKSKLEKWDGKAAERIVRVLRESLASSRVMPAT